MFRLAAMGANAVVIMFGLARSVFLMVCRARNGNFYILVDNVNGFMRLRFFCPMKKIRRRDNSDAPFAKIGITKFGNGFFPS